MLAIAIITGIIGFLIVLAFGYSFEYLVVRKYSTNSPLFVDYYYWVYVFGFGLTMYNILEAYCQSIRRPVFATFLKEVEWRVLILILVILFATGVINDFGLFIKLYALTYPCIALTMLIYLISTGSFKLNFKISFVTKRIRKILFRFTGVVYFSIVVSMLSQVFDSLVIGSVVEDGLTNLAIFTFAQLMTSVIQAPQRGVINVSVAHLANAWKQKDLKKISDIYTRSSINLLIISLLLFCLIALNFVDAVHFFKLKPEWALGFSAFIVMGITRVIDLGTGVNAQVIATSKYWRFETWSGVILLIIILPLSYLFAKAYGIVGPPIAGLISYAIYNGIRIYFLWKKFALFPFNIKTAYNIVLAAVAFFSTYFLFKEMHCFWALVGRSVFFAALYITGVIYLKMSPDIKPVLEAVLNRTPWGKKK
ncbi:lipopolysaccharide biosynthesis protein [Niabella ginsengisoli]|uniref:Lipopolysaccharide biosynthesis protein n=1 Tax=Niabella ginsengisoli TaxID=522298 RepID=A0ABS9SE40_9BACT|nr:lipopolysaccharide biosynthesis protein [Niabella ginsengisoli]MCH5596628.1 lipopolysaccharide biosynthesis protein [Niabella ginsengisoli]